QNLRGGAGVMVGNALICLAIAIGLVFQLLQKPTVIEHIAYGFAIFQIAAAGEIVLNLILNLYRPRRAGEVPRAAFDSRVLSLLAAPDSIARSVGEAINYQFGFDIASSWGYRLLLRSVAWLLGFGAVVLLLLSTVVVVEPGKQAVILKQGRLQADVKRDGVLFKLPWPFEQAQMHDVATIREISLGGVVPRARDVNLWGQAEAIDPERRPFIVGATADAAELQSAMEMLDGGSLGGGAGPAAGGILGGGSILAAGVSTPSPEAGSGSITNQFALVDADVLLRYRIKPDGLLDWLGFCNDTRLRRSALDMRERALRDLAVREVTQAFSTQPLDAVLSPQGDSLVTELRRRIQRSFDEHSTGVEVVSIMLPRLRPPGEEAGRFEELSIAAQNSRKIVEQARQTVNSTMATLVGDAGRAASIVAAIEALRELGRREGTESEAYLQTQVEVEQMLLDSRAMTASVISTARARRWQLHMEARRKAEEVLGEAPAYAVDPELYRQRALMQALAEVLPRVRVKYVLSPDPERVRLDLSMQQPDSGLNLADTIGESLNP
ncbi:MAG: SPFH domain-containing protein, partial [Phycisphaerales bacterium]